jgi:hypothetical protein
MCVNQLSLPNWVKTPSLIVSVIGVLIAVASLWVSCSSQDIANSSLAIAKRNDVPNVQIMQQLRLEATSDPNTYTLKVFFQNFGTKDATGTIKIGAINSTTKEVALIDAPERFTRLSPKKTGSTTAMFTVRKAALHDFLMVCVLYSDKNPDIAKS